MYMSDFEWTNPPKVKKDKEKKDSIDEIYNTISDIVLDKKLATSNLDVYIKSENILQMSLNTNSVTFEDFSGVEDMIKENENFRQLRLRILFL